MAMVQRLPRQLSLFGVEARPPSPLDLEGLLAGAGQVTRMGGTARVSIVVDSAWRAAALQAECALRGLVATSEPSNVEGYVAFRTAYSTALAPLCARWLRGAMKHPPDRFALDGRRLRLWVIAAGSPDGAQAFTLRFGTTESLAVREAAAREAAPDFARAPAHEGAHREEDGPVGAALAAAGLPAVLVGPRAGGPAYRIVGRRRLARLAEMIGEPPPHAPPGEWPV
jgi:hypothetical protein